MSEYLSVGIETSCIAPLKIERSLARLYRLLGVDSLFVPDHYLSFTPRQVWGPGMSPAADIIPSLDAFFDPFVMMGAMATRHPRAYIGTGVTEPFRRHPVTLAQAFVTIDHLTNGRAILGIGNGERENTEPYGIPFEKRVGRLEEALEIIRLLWESNGEPISYDGKIWKLKGAIFATPLYNGRSPRIWVASHAPRMLGLTGRFGDGWYPTNKMDGDGYRASLSKIRSAADKEGRSLDGFEPAMQIITVLGKNREAVLEGLLKVPAAAAMSMLLPAASWKQQGLEHPLGPKFEGFPDFVPQEISNEQIEEARVSVTPELMGSGLFAGNPDEIVDELRPLVDAGLRHVVIWNVSPIVSGATASGMLQIAMLIRKLKKLKVQSF